MRTRTEGVVRLVFEAHFGAPRHRLRTLLQGASHCAPLQLARAQQPRERLDLRDCFLQSPLALGEHQAATRSLGELGVGAACRPTQRRDAARSDEARTRMRQRLVVRRLASERGVTGTATCVARVLGGAERAARLVDRMGTQSSELLERFVAHPARVRAQLA